MTNRASFDMAGNLVGAALIIAAIVVGVRVGAWIF